MKKRLLLIILVIGVFTLTGCFGSNEEKKSERNEETAFSFKNDYESINGKENSHGKIHRTIEISKDNRFVEVTPEEIVKKIENKETFYVYFGSRLCPWCRSVLEVADQQSRDKEIDVIYYVDIWDDEGNEILRDKYILNDNNELELSVEGTEAYKKLVEYFDKYLDDYTLTDSNGNKVPVGEKRIFAPNFVYVENGVAERLTTGISSKQKDSREELTEEMLQDEENAFNKFFSTSCDDKC